MPVWQSGKADSLRTHGFGHRLLGTRVRGALVAGEIALALVLLAGAGLMVRSLAAVGRVQPGFDTRNLAMLGYRVPRSRYPTGPSKTSFTAM